MTYLAGFLELTRGRGHRRDAALLQKMQRALSHRGTGAPLSWNDEHSGLIAGGHPHGDHELLHSGSSGLTIVCDGYFENADELRTTLRVPGASTAELLAAAHRCWGESLVGHLHGEFAIAVCDGEGVFLARDPSGLRPLFYALSADRLLFASEIKALFQDPSLGARPHRGLIADHLFGRYTRCDETFFEGVRRLEWGSCLRCHRDGSWSTQVFAERINRSGKKSIHTEEEARSQMRRVLRDALEPRVRNRHVCLFLSSGLDSTSVLSVYQESRRGDPGMESRLSVVSSYYGRIPACNERPRVEETARMYGIEPVYVRSDDCWALRESETPPSIRRDEPVRGLLLDRLEARMVGAARATGADRLLTGLGGDEVFSASLWHLNDLCRRGLRDSAEREIAAAPEELRGIAGAFCDAVPEEMLSPLWLPPVEGMLPDTMELHRQRLRAATAPRTGDFESLAAWDEYSAANSFEFMIRAEIVRGIALEEGLDVIHPLLSVPVIRVALSVDQDLKLANGYIKNLARIVLHGRAPDAVRDRKSKVYLNGIVDFGLLYRERRRIAALLANPWVVEAGLVTPGFCKAVLEHYRRGDHRARALFLRILGLELWGREWF